MQVAQLGRRQPGHRLARQDVLESLHLRQAERLIGRHPINPLLHQGLDEFVLVRIRDDAIGAVRDQRDIFAARPICCKTWPHVSSYGPGSGALSCFRVRHSVRRISLNSSVSPCASSCRASTCRMRSRPSRRTIVSRKPRSGTTRNVLYRNGHDDASSRTITDAAGSAAQALADGANMRLLTARTGAYRRSEHAFADRANLRLMTARTGACRRSQQGLADGANRHLQTI